MSNAFVDKNLYKIFLIIIKFIPNILAVIKMCSLVLNYCKITTFTLTCLGGTSIITLLVLYLISYVFKFCGIHRISLHYVSLIYVITIIDYYIGIPLSLDNIYHLYAIITGIFITSWIYVWYTHRHNTRIDYIKRLCDSYC